MITYIAFLRGINVGGHKKILMQELRDLLSKHFKEVKTYIQSGNVVFKSSEEDKNKLEIEIKNALLKHFKFDVPVLVKTVDEIENILFNCPFSEEKKEKSYFTLLQTKPLKENVELINTITYPNEEFKVINDCIYFFSSVGYGNVKFNNNLFEKKLKVSATSRNYRTLIKVLNLTKN